MQKLIYLDWNTISHLSSNVLPKELETRLFNLRDLKDYLIPFSPEHITEMIRDQNITETNFPVEIDAWCSYLSTISLNKYWRIEPKTHENIFENYDPKKIIINRIQSKTYLKSDTFSFKKEFNLLTDSIRSLLQLTLGYAKIKMMQQTSQNLADFNITLHEGEMEDICHEFVQKIDQLNKLCLGSSYSEHGLDPRILNNYSGTKLDDKISEKLNKIGYNGGLQDILNKLKELMPSSNGFGSAGVNALYEHLGFRRDKSDVTFDSKQSDNMHIEFGLRSDIFITNDIRLYHRAIETKRFLNNNITTVLLAKEAIEKLNDF